MFFQLVLVLRGVESDGLLLAPELIILRIPMMVLLGLVLQEQVFFQLMVQM